MWKNLICNIFKHSKVLLDLLNCSSEVASVKKNICSSKTKSYLRDKTWLKSLILSSVAIFKRMLEYNVKPFIFLKAQAFVCLFLCGSWYFQIWHQLQSPNWLHNSDSKHFLHQSFKTTNASASTLFYSIFFCFCLKWEKCNVWPPHDCPVGGEVCRNSWITETVVQQEREGGGLSQGNILRSNCQLSANLKTCWFSLMIGQVQVMWSNTELLLAVAHCVGLTRSQQSQKHWHLKSRILKSNHFQHQTVSCSRDKTRWITNLKSRELEI